MGWRATVEGNVFDTDTGEHVATCGGDKVTAYSRACLISVAPLLYEALTDMIVAADKNFPKVEALQEQLKEHKQLLDEVRKRYEQRT